MSKRHYTKSDKMFGNHKVDYTDSYTEEMDREGLNILVWSMFDTPEKLGSGKMFMETAPVVILDNVFKDTNMVAYIELGYTSKAYADRLALPSNNSHRTGTAVRFRCINKTKRLKFVRSLIQYGIERIHLFNESIYFDTDHYIKPSEILFYNE